MTFIRAELRFKNGALCHAIESMGLTQVEFAKRIDIAYTTINNYISFTKYPSIKQIEKICDFLGQPKHELFYKYHAQYQSKASNVIKWDISEPQFKRISEQSINYKLLGADFKKDLDSVLSTLTENQKKCIKLYFLEEMTLKQIGDELDLTQERVRQIVSKGIRRMQNPIRSKVLKDYL